MKTMSIGYFFLNRRQPFLLSVLLETVMRLSFIITVHLGGIGVTCF